MVATLTKMSPKSTQTTALETITPKKAEEYLQANTHNRVLSDTTVDTLAEEMKAGRWRLHHQGIAFDRAGVLRDGQHRLWAVVRSGATVDMLVTHGLDPAVFDTIDAHRPRRVGDQLILTHGLPNGRRIAATATALHTIEEDCRFGKRLAVGFTMEIYKRHKAGIDFVLDTITSGPFSKAPMTGPIAFAYPTNKVKVALFAKQVRDGERLTKKDPAYALRALVINSASGMSSTVDRRALVGLTLRCMHAFCEGQFFSSSRQMDPETYQLARKYFLKAHE